MIINLQLNGADVKVVISTLNNSSTSHNKMPGMIPKQTIDFHVKSIIYSTNMSLESGTYPDRLKITKVLPIFKDGSSLDILYSRPIHTITFSSKLFERVFYIPIRKR